MTTTFYDRQVVHPDGRVSRYGFPDPKPTTEHDAIMKLEDYISWLQDQPEHVRETVASVRVVKVTVDIIPGTEKSFAQS